MHKLLSKRYNKAMIVVENNQNMLGGIKMKKVFKSNGNRDSSSDVGKPDRLWRRAHPPQPQQLRGS